MPALFFNEIAGSITLPLTATETSVVSMSVTASAGENIKIDFAQSVEAIATSNWTLTYEARLYRDTTLIHTRIFNRSQATAGTQRFPMSDTYVDTAVATGTVTYDVRIIITAQTNISSATSNNRDINGIVFP